ncbi:hypothetical protein [Pseudomonas sp.]|uniref:hypothetical protein n=1 Tax=Pseudomonas sp. TaxID=306 RepID=UPI002C7973E0|nr:hypothetical protein [Pseudomonas sp.]HUE90571.1 hypothetical protein [Pseudomonas sp.]
MSEAIDTSEQSPAGVSSVILTIAALGAICVLAAGGAQPLAVGLASLLLGLGAVATLHYRSYNRVLRYAHQTISAKLHATGARDDQAICACAQAPAYRYILPIWAGQIEATRTLTAEAISTLTKHFSRMSQRVERATAAAQSGTTMSGGLTLLLGSSRQELEETVVSLRAALATKEVLHYEVTELSRLTEQLQTLTQDLGNIAEQTNQVALNANQTNQENQGLAAVTDEICRLSSLCSETGKRIGETVDAVNTTIASSLSTSCQYTEQNGATALNAGEVIEHVIKRFRSATNTLLKSSRELHEESQAVGQDITQVLANLQFQGRVTQVLDLVRCDLEKLHLTLVQADTLRRHPLARPTPAHSRPA